MQKVSVTQRQASCDSLTSHEPIHVQEGLRFWKSKNSAPSLEELHQAFEHRSQPPGAGIYVTCHFFPPTSVYFKAVAGVRYVLKWEQYEHFLAAVYNNSILR